MRKFKAQDYIAGGTIGIFSEKRDNNEIEHSHDFIEIVYVLSGSAVQIVDKQHYAVNRGDVVFINYGASHAFQAGDNFQYINICFLPDIIGDKIINKENALALLSLTAFDELRQAKNGGRLSFTGADRREVELLLENMLREYSQQKPLSQQVLENYLSILLTKMLRITLTEENAVQTQDTWQALQEYIDENLGQELTLNTLAKQSFYNPSYFSRMFKQKFGISLSHYLRQRRIQYAQSLLQNTTLSIEAIMQQVGYTDRSAFYHAFGKLTGLAPAEYRDNVKNSHSEVK